MQLVTLLGFRTAAREATDMVGDTFITDAWLNTRINANLSEVWDRVADSGPTDRIAATALRTVSAGLSAVDLPVDMRNLLDVYVVDNGRRLALEPTAPGAMSTYLAPSKSYAVEIDYLPTCPQLLEDGDTFDATSGWSELALVMTCWDIQVRRDRDRSPFESRLPSLWDRVSTRARRYNRGRPQRVLDLDEVGARDIFSSAKLSHYRLRGQVLEVYEQ